MSEQHGDAEDLVDHIIKRQIEPQRIADELRAEGTDVDIHFVNTNPEVKGFPVSCAGCGRTATLPFDPGTKVGVCPDCARKAR